MQSIYLIYTFGTLNSHIDSGYVSDGELCHYSKCMAHGTRHTQSYPYQGWICNFQLSWICWSDERKLVVLVR